MGMTELALFGGVSNESVLKQSVQDGLHCGVGEPMVVFVHVALQVAK